MEERSENAFANREGPIPVIDRDTTEDMYEDEPVEAGAKHGKRQRLMRHISGSSLKEKVSSGKPKASSSRTSIQDRVLETLLQKFIPVEDLSENRGDTKEAQEQSYAERPAFNLTTMTINFRRFNSRIGVVFVGQVQLFRLLSWKTPTHTISLLAVYTFICLDPFLLCFLPLVAILGGILIPAFIARHPAPPATLSNPDFEYSPSGPAIGPAVTVKPVKELSKDFFRNMRDLQNLLGDFSYVHDKLVDTIAPPTNFSNEPLSSTIFLFLTFSSIALFFSSHLIPLRPIILVGGWLIICSGHPSAQSIILNFHRHQILPYAKKIEILLDKWVERDIIIDGAPEVREVEIFELQKKTNAGEWEPWVFSPDPWDSGSYARVHEEKLAGTRFFEDVRPPNGWCWSESKWSLDLWSREWVEERCITSVEVETEGERWVWDLSLVGDGREELESLLGSSPAKNKSKSIWKGKGKSKQEPGWEEGTENKIGRRGEWRRRRWTRLVRRKDVEGKGDKVYVLRGE